MHVVSTSIVPSLALASVEFYSRTLERQNYYLVLATRSFLLLLYEVGGGGWRRSGPHAADDSNAVLRERWEAQLLPLPNLDALQLLEAAQGELRQETRFQTSTSAAWPPSRRQQEGESHQNALPQQQKHLLHGEVRGVSTAELGDHPEEHDRNGLIVEKRRTCGRGKGNWRVNIKSMWQTTASL